MRRLEGGNAQMGYIARITNIEGVNEQRVDAGMEPLTGLKEPVEGWTNED